MIVGILGGGQLARMLALAGHPLGLNFAFLDPAPDACAFPLGEAVQGAYDDAARLEELAERADLVTCEFENVPANSSRILSERVPVYPPSEALALTQDRLQEKRLFQEIGIPIAPIVPVSGPEDLRDASVQLGFPLVLKTRSYGYDGKGQLILRRESDLTSAWETLGRVPLIAEHFVSFQREVSILAVRSRNGETAFYPLSENVHRDGILFTARSRPRDPLEPLARDYAERLLSRLHYVGVLALEFFHDGDQLLANEYAPRVHNSGHWTIEGAETSQFENHLRAILDLPLGETSPVGRVAMINCIGALPDSRRAAQVKGAHLHVYGKPPRPGRKVGHVTVRANDESALQERLEQVCGLLDRNWPK